MSDTALTSVAKQDASPALAQLHELSQNTIYLMGVSFILGCLFTILMLLILDFMRRNHQPSD